MSGQKHSAEKLLEQKNRHKPKTTPAVEHGQNSLGLADVPIELFLASQDDHGSSQDTLLNTGNLQEAQKIALALKINRVQGNNHLQRVISLKRRTEASEEEIEEAIPAVGTETTPTLERGGNGRNKESVTEAALPETHIKPGKNGNRGSTGEEPGVKSESAGNETLRTESFEEPRRMESSDLERGAIRAVSSRESKTTGGEKGVAEGSSGPELGVAGAVKGEAVPEPGEKPGKPPMEVGLKEPAPASADAELTKGAGPEEAPKHAAEAPEQALLGGGGSGEALATEFRAAGGKETAENIPTPVVETGMPIFSGGGTKADLLGDFASHTAYQKMKVGDAVEAQQEQLVMDGNATKAKFLAEMGVKLAAAYAAFNNQKDELEQQRKIQKNRIEDERKAHKQQVDQGYQVQFAILSLAFIKRRAEMIKNGDTRAASVRAFAQKSKEKIASSTIAKFSRAIAIGEEKAKFYAPQKRGAEIGDVARKIASNMAGKIMQSGANAINTVAKDGNDKANEISAMASKAASKFTEGLVKSIAVLVVMREKAKREIDKVADLLIKKVDPVIDNSIAAINGLKIPLLTNMSKVAAGFPAKVDLGVIKGKKVLAYAGQQRINDIQDGFMTANNKILGSRGLRGRRLRSLITRLTRMMTSSREASVGEIERGGAALRANQGKGLTETIGKLGEMIGRLQLELTKAFLAVIKGFDAMLQGAGMAKISSLAVGMMALVVINYDQKLVEAIGKANSELDKAVTKTQDGITKKENVTQNAQVSMLLELDKKIDKKARDMQRSWIVRGFAWLGGFLLNLGISVLKFLGIILGVIIALALIAAAIGAIVGLVFVLLYSLVGAALAGMIALIVGLVLAAVAGLAALAVMVYGIYTLVKTVSNNIITIFTDDSLTAYERGSLTGETTGDVAMTVLPFIPKVRIGATNLLGKIGAKLRIPYLKGLAPKAGAPAEPAVAAPAKPSALAPTEPMPAARPGEGLPSPLSVVEKPPKVPEGLPSPAEVVPAKPSALPPTEPMPAVPARPSPYAPTEPMPAVPAKPSPALGKTEPPLGPSEPVPAVKPGGPGEIPAPLRGEPTLPPIKPKPPVRQPYAAVPRSPIAKRMNDIPKIRRLRDYFYRTPGKVVLELNKIEMHQRWWKLGQKGEPPAAFISSEGYLYVDINKVGELKLSRWAELNRIREAAEARGARPPVEPSPPPSPGLGKTEPPLSITQPPLPTAKPPTGTPKPPAPAEAAPLSRGARRTTEPPKTEPPVMAPPSEIPTLVRRVSDIVEVELLREHMLYYQPKLLNQVGSSTRLLKIWRVVLNQKGEPPPAFVTSEGKLYVDLNKVPRLSRERIAELKLAGEEARSEASNAPKPAEPAKPETGTVIVSPEIAGPTLSRTITSVTEAEVLMKSWLFYRPNKLLEVFSKNELLDTWRLVLKQKGDPPPAFITSDGTLYVDLNQVPQLSPARHTEIKFAGQKARGEYK
jgi:hypothetical protein